MPVLQDELQFFTQGSLIYFCRFCKQPPRIQRAQQKPRISEAGITAFDTRRIEPSFIGSHLTTAMSTHLQFTSKVQAALSPHRDAVLFVQDVVCFQRPIWSALYSAALVALWRLLVSEWNLMAQMSMIGMGVFATDLALDQCNKHGINVLSKMKQLGGSPKPLLAAYGQQRCRTFDDLCSDAGRLWQRVSDAHKALRETHQNAPGQVSVVAVFLLLALAAISSNFSNSTTLLLFLLTTLLVPVLERFPKVRAICAMLAPHLRTVLFALVGAAHWVLSYLPDRIVVVDGNAEERPFEASLHRTDLGTLNMTQFAPSQATPTQPDPQVQPPTVPQDKPEAQVSSVQSETDTPPVSVANDPATPQTTSAGSTLPIDLEDEQEVGVRETDDLHSELMHAFEPDNVQPRKSSDLRQRTSASA
eukprot:m.10401 g.10401  ORF g.10401 m.10401 type:complete len:417 (-) comp5558_c0_seq1:339-1589(-)